MSLEWSFACQNLLLTFPPFPLRSGRSFQSVWGQHNFPAPLQFSFGRRLLLGACSLDPLLSLHIFTVICSQVLCFMKSFSRWFFFLLLQLSLKVVPYSQVFVVFFLLFSGGRIQSSVEKFFMPFSTNFPRISRCFAKFHIPLQWTCVHHDLSFVPFSYFYLILKTKKLNSGAHAVHDLSLTIFIIFFSFM